MKVFSALLLLLPSVTLGFQRINEVWTREQEDAAGIVREFVVNPLPQASNDMIFWFTFFLFPFSHPNPTTCNSAALSPLGYGCNRRLACRLLVGQPERTVPCHQIAQSAHPPVSKIRNNLDPCARHTTSVTQKTSGSLYSGKTCIQIWKKQQMQAHHTTRLNISTIQAVVM